MEVGIVSRVSSNGSGFQIEGHSEWFNISKLGPAMQKGCPDVGSLIEFEHEPWNGKPWVKDWEYRAEEAVESGWRKDLSQAEHGPGAWLQDDRPVVTRLACLNAAVRTWQQYSSGEPLEHLRSAESEILGLAERYVAWATWGGGDQWQREEMEENLDHGSEPGPGTSANTGRPAGSSATRESPSRAPARSTKR